MRYVWIFVLIIIFMSSCATTNRISKIPAQKPIQEEQAVVIQEEPVKKPEPESTPVCLPASIQVEERLEDMISAELRALEGGEETIKFDVPVTINKDVQTWITYFLGRGRKSFVRALGRSTRYLPLMKRIFREEGLPEDLVYLSMIESHFVVHAYSRAHAVGLWQFIRPTARRYGLKINGYVDERRHPEKSTRAATAYLSDLHEMFGSWYLVAAAYNAGENKVKSSLRRSKAETFWEIAKKGLLRRETRNYVPKFLAAVLLAKDPERFGLNEVAYEPPLEFDEVEISYPVDLSVVAGLCNTNVNTIRRLNPELRVWYTPLNDKHYKIWVPKGSGARFRERYARLKPHQRLVSRAHKVTRGENLGSIARRYGVSVESLKQYNKLRSNIIYAGSTLKIPIGTSKYRIDRSRYQGKTVNRAAIRPPGGNKIIYEVEPGDNIWRIAQDYNLNWRDIAAWNNIADVRRLMPGQKLILYLAEPKKVIFSSTLKDEAKSQPLSAPKKANAVNMPSTSPQAPEKGFSYTVRSGDTLWAIARRFNIELAQIRSLNNIKSNLIRPGDVLTLPTEKM